MRCHYRAWILMVGVLWIRRAARIRGRSNGTLSMCRVRLCSMAVNAAMVGSILGVLGQTIIWIRRISSRLGMWIHLVRWVWMFVSRDLILPVPLFFFAVLITVSVVQFISAPVSRAAAIRPSFPISAVGARRAGTKASGPSRP